MRFRPGRSNPSIRCVHAATTLTTRIVQITKLGNLLRLNIESFRFCCAVGDGGSLLAQSLHTELGSSLRVPSLLVHL